MSIGIAFSGGGIPAAIGAACAWNAIAEVYPSLIDPENSQNDNLAISTVSGGSVDDIYGGDIPWISSYALLDESPPPERDRSKGTLTASSTERLRHVHADMNRPERSALDVLSYTSAFWVAPLVTTTAIPYKLFSNLLLRADDNDDASRSVERAAVAPDNNRLILDGGVVDTTGLVGLLRRRTQNVVAFYNNNVPLSELASPIAYLFGVDVPTDSMNGLLGPSLSWVFPSKLYPRVMANLTNPKIGVARLANVDVVRNRKLGVEPYVIRSLVVFSNARNDGFIAPQEGPKRGSARLSSGWPDRYFFAPPRLDADALCMFNDWKVRNHREELDPVLG